MTKYYQLGGERVPYLPSHLGGTAVVPNGTATLLTLPTGVGSVYFKAEGQDAYYQVGGTTSSAASHGYVPSGQSDMIFPCDNLGTISVFQASGGTIHAQYYAPSA